MIQENYPDLAIPYHARWRHFAAGGIDRWGALAVRLRGYDRDEIVRLRIDLCTVSVLLDAGAGASWTYREPGTGQVLTRSEGLAVASLHAFCSGLFSADPRQPFRADADGLSRLTDAALAEAFQVSPDNSLAGVAGRAALLRALARHCVRGRIWQAWTPASEDCSISGGRGCREACWQRAKCCNDPGDARADLARTTDAGRGKSGRRLGAPRSLASCPSTNCRNG